MFSNIFQAGRHTGPMLMLRIALAFGIAIASTTASAFGPQSSNKAAEWNFDFVEEFDGLQDWTGPSARVGNDFNVANMPKLANGSNSAWGYYSKWGDSRKPPAPWIGSETGSGRKIWRGTKSLTMDLGETAYGPSRLGVWFGKGYSSFNLFHMVYIPKNVFPTSCNPAGCLNGSIGEYREGQSYIYFPAWKFGTFDMDCQNADCRVGTGTESYGAQHFVPVFRPSSPTGLSQGIYIFNEKNNSPSATHRSDDGSGPVSRLFGQWMGYELQVRSTGATTFLVDIWIYDQNGKEDHILRNASYSIAPEHVGKLWDRFFFGGNNSNSWSWGPTMQSHYWVDDLIIDDHSKGRIGPRYFAVIGGKDNAAPPSPPANTGGVQLP